MYHSNLATSSPSSPSSPIEIGDASSASSTSSTSSTSSSREDNYSKGMSCAFPSWHRGSFQTSAPSSYISDADLFGDLQLENDADVPLLREAPAPPREVPAVAMPLLPLYASGKPKKQRRRSSKKQQRPAQPMTPIVESPATCG